MVKAKVTKAKGRKKVEEESEEDSGGLSVDDAFADDEDVDYAPSKPAKIKKKSAEEIEDDLEEAEESLESFQNKLNGDEDKAAVTIKASKPISKIKKGDRIKIDGKEYTVDAHYVLMDHGTTKEMTIELFDNNDKDFQLRYFDDQVETTLDFYELQEIMYLKKQMIKIEW